MRTAQVQVTLRIHAVSPEPSLLANLSCRSWGTFSQRTKVLDLIRGWVCTLKRWQYILFKWPVFCVVVHTMHFFFPLCKIVWGNYVPRFNVWALSWENLLIKYMCEQQRCRSTCASAQCDQCFCCSQLGKYNYFGHCMPKFVVFETEQARFCLTWSETPKTGFLTTKPIQ